MNRYLFLTLLLLAFVTTPFTICSLAPDLTNYAQSSTQITATLIAHDTQEHSADTEPQADAGVSLMEEVHHDIELSLLFYSHQLNNSNLSFNHQDQNHDLFNFSQDIFRPNI
jgi:hypothetical protein